MDMTKRDVKQALGLTRDSDLASLFSIKRQAVFLWPADAPIPKARQWELRCRFPKLFKRGKPRLTAVG